MYLILALAVVVVQCGDSGGGSNNKDFLSVVNVVPSASSSSLSPSQCLVLRADVARTICSEKLTQRNLTMRRTRLGFCDDFHVYRAIDAACERDISSASAHTCNDCLARLEALDRQAHDTFCHFKELMRHFDCDTPYSTHGNCKLCEVRQ